MFKAKLEDVGLLQQMNKSSVRGIRSTLVKEFPEIEDLLDTVIPKKANIQVVKLKNEFKMNLVLVEEEITFFDCDGMAVPTLQLLLQYPDIMKKMVVDKGGIPRVVTGANIMCPGLTSAGGNVEPNVEVGTIVQICGEGK